MISQKHMPSFIHWQRSVDSLGYHSVAMVMNAADYGIPQNRDRLFMVSIRNDIHQTFSPPSQIHRRLKFEDIIETNVEEKYYFTHSEAVRYYMRLSGKEIDDKAMANIPKPQGGRPIWWMPSLTCKDRHTGIVIPTLKATGYNYFKSKNCFSTGYYPQCAILEIWQGNCSKEIDYDELLNSSRPSSEKITNAGRHLIIDRLKRMDKREYIRLRRMTPREQFRFMGVSETDIDRLLASGNSDAKLYKQAGNSIVVDVLYCLFKQLLIDKK